MFGTANRNSRIGQLSPSVALGVLPVFATTLFLSAVLLFWVQPMFTKMVLPLLGGAPSVWNTAMLFFQTMLLAGYAYAHLTSRLLRFRWQVLLHGIVLAVALGTLPLGVADGWSPPSDGTPVIWLIGLYAVSVGLPFFAISATAPLLQRWFSHTGHETAEDPYYLYAASNIGSILALFAYPIILEPMLTLAGQSWAWTIGYVALCMMIAASAVKVFRSAGDFRAPAGSLPAQARATGPTDAIGWQRRAHWVFLAFVPSSLLLGVTTHITTDVAAAPFLWVIPLALYLLTFVLTFARNPLLPHRRLLQVHPFVMILGAAFFWATNPFYLLLPLHLLVFFVAAMVCHGELIGRRPAASHLTEFYFWMSFGGMLGGVFNALLAPVLLDSIAEYPLVLALACLARPWPKDKMRALRRIDWLGAVLVAALLLISDVILGRPVTSDSDIAVVLMFLILPVLAFLSRSRPGGLAIGLGALLVFGPILMHNGETLVRDRSFFGVYSVRAQQDGAYHILMHGTTHHGAQYRDAERRRLPTAYYYPTGPVGGLFDALNDTRTLRRVGVIGLGSGALSCYRRDAQSWTFYEIDPAVTALAQDLRYFHHLAECAPGSPVVHGDARLSLEAERDGHFDLLISDAFSSDSIPVHLVTREALQLFVDKLAPNGVLLINISNRNIDLEPVLAELAQQLGVAARIAHFRPTSEERANSALNADWVVMTRPGEDAFLDGHAAWSDLRREPGTRAWTDDYSNIVGALRWW